MALDTSIRATLAFIKSIPKGINIFLWSGIPCTGGSPAQNMNKHRAGHDRRMRNHRKLWVKLFRNFVVLAQAVVRRGGHLALQWPTRCRY